MSLLHNLYSFTYCHLKTVGTQCTALAAILLFYSEHVCVYSLGFISQSAPLQVIAGEKIISKRSHQTKVIKEDFN